QLHPQKADAGGLDGDGGVAVGGGDPVESPEQVPQVAGLGHLHPEFQGRAGKVTVHELGQFLATGHLVHQQVLGDEILIGGQFVVGRVAPVEGLVEVLGDVDDG